MKKITILCLLAVAPGLTARATTIERIQFGIFGQVMIYRPATVQSVALFVSGDGGWNSGVVDMAKAFTTMNALVVGIDNLRYMKQLNKATGACSYPASDFENLSLFIQKKYGLAQYEKPVLVGYSSGLRWRTGCWRRHRPIHSKASLRLDSALICLSINRCAWVVVYKAAC